MINVEVFIGSPRKRGNTQYLVKQLIEGLDKDKFQVNQTSLYDIEIKPCVDCRGCKINDLDCIVDDDMTKVYNQLEKADLLIFGTPIYWFGPSGQMKMLIDRLRPYNKNRKLEKKHAAIVMPAGVGSGDCDLTIDMFKRIFKALGINFMGSVTSEAFDIGDSENDQDAKSQVRILLEQLNSM